jgi:hypothetical protein
MAEERAQRRLAAILAADVVGYAPIATKFRGAAKRREGPKADIVRVLALTVDGVTVKVRRFTR